VSDPAHLALLILGLPLAATLLTPLFAAARLQRYAHLPAILGFTGAAAAALALLIGLATETGTPNLVYTPATWFAAGDLRVNVTLGIDPLAAIMLAMVTFIATWIALFSVGYMHAEEGYTRFFTLISLFVFCMCLLVLSNNFLLLLAGWEGVGLCSYLLVGYYYAKPSAAAAARKAFLVTRLGDVGLLIGIFLLWQIGGYHTDLDRLFEYIANNPPPTETMTAACLLLFCGAVGKSAQIPLYVWLPDAMEGPTPVSALIHAATMVTAGVYLLARCAPLFILAPAAQITVSVIGGATALLTAFIALTQTDLKRILAYSTVSQLGFMFMALGTAGAVTPSLAIMGGIFHLFTHAFFKALLFLGSGSVMHAMGNVIDVRKFGGLRHIMPVTHITFLLGVAALAGMPLLSGFWSKDLILEDLDLAGEVAGEYRAGYWFVYGLALATAFLTSFYAFRAYFLTFWGPERIPLEAGHHAQESPQVMTVPLIVLAVGAVFAGFAVGPFAHFLEGSYSVGLANQVYAMKYNIDPTPELHFNWFIAIVSSLLALAGAGVAFQMYKDGRPEEVPESFQTVYALSRNKVYVDEVYEGTVVKPAEFLAGVSRQLDGLLDWLARLLAYLPRAIGAFFRPLQNGLIQYYALSMSLMLAALIVVVVFRVIR
jgi:NADH-quinone oxidoreductase subunit L